MNEPENTIKVVRTILGERLSIPAEDIHPEANLRDDLGMDSIDALEFAQALEESLGVPIVDEQFRALQTIGDVVELLCMPVGETTS
jgi:acyl carrier protein